MEELPRINKVIQKPKRPERVLQFGTGNFLRAFADWMLAEAARKGAYDSSVVICQPTSSGRGKVLNEQDCLYTLLVQGLDPETGAAGSPAIDEAQVIDSVSRCLDPYREEGWQEVLELARSRELQVIVSNTTEAGIIYRMEDRLTNRPPASFPGKLCVFLYERWQHFRGAETAGLLLLPCELIERNGDRLREYLLRHAAEWGLPEAFGTWIRDCCPICSTLVDRIVPGYPREEEESLWERLGYTDRCMVTAEPFALWVIEENEEAASAGRRAFGKLPSELRPLQKAGLPIHWTKDVTPYKERKVRILNGAHTGLSLSGVLNGHLTVREMLSDPYFYSLYRELVCGEVIPAAEGILPKEELQAFANETEARFLNPYLRHRLLDIALNSCSKMRERLLPSLLDWYKKVPADTDVPAVPAAIARAFAAFIRFYRIRPSRAEDGSMHYYGQDHRGQRYEVRDEERWLQYFSESWKEYEAVGAEEMIAPAAHALTEKVLSNGLLWGMDLCRLSGFGAAVAWELSEMWF